MARLGPNGHLARGRLTPHARAKPKPKATPEIEPETETPPTQKRGGKKTTSKRKLENSSSEPSRPDGKAGKTDDERPEKDT